MKYVSQQDVAGAFAGMGKPDIHAVSLEAAAPGITFASDWDAACYRVLVARQRKLHAQLEAVEHELNAVLYRAHWSVEAILDHDG